MLALAAEAGTLAEAAAHRLGLSRESGEGTAGREMPSTDVLSDAVAAFRFPDDLWARVFYDLLVSASFGETAVERLVAAFVPIYFGRVGQPGRREPASLGGAGRGARRAAGSRVRAAASRTWSSAGGRPRRRRRPRPDRGRGRRPEDCREVGQRRPMTRASLPSRILIPVANPLTAQELVRVGASLHGSRDRQR